MSSTCTQSEEITHGPYLREVVHTPRRAGGWHSTTAPLPVIGQCGRDLGLSPHAQSDNEQHDQDRRAESESNGLHRTVRERRPNQGPDDYELHSAEQQESLELL